MLAIVSSIDFVYIKRRVFSYSPNAIDMTKELLLYLIGVGSVEVTN